jgi:hypothetical protein
MKRVPTEKDLVQTFNSTIGPVGSAGLPVGVGAVANANENGNEDGQSGDGKK